MNFTAKNLYRLHMRRFIMDARLKPAHDVLDCFRGVSGI
jgi:hypothetical protein